MNPIFTIETITTARRSRYFLWRVIYALGMLFVLWSSYQSSGAYWNNNYGVVNVAREFFTHFTWVQLVAILLLTPAMVAGTIAGEFERKTLDYLLACPLSSWSILTGKLGARSLLAALLVGAGIPVLAAAMMLGGIPPGALFASSVNALLTLLLTGAITLATSVWSVRTRDAVLRTYVLLLAMLLLPLIGSQARYAFSGSPGWSPVGDWITTVSQPLAKINPFAVAYSDDLSVFVWSCVSYVALTAALVAFAAWRLRAVAAWRSGAAARVWIKRRWRLPRPPVTRYPILWKEMFIEKTALRWGCLVRLALLAIVASVGVPTVWIFVEAWQRGYKNPEGLYVVYGWLSSLGLLFATARGATLMTSERERDTWLVLLSTNLSPHDILAGKIMGNLYAMRMLGLALVAIWCLACALRPTDIWKTPLVFGELLLLMTFCSTMAVKFSLMCRTSMAAMGSAIGTALFIGGGYMLCCIFPIGMLARASDGGSEAFSLAAAPCLPFLLAFPLFVTELNGREAIPVSMAWIFGTAGYLVATVLLYLRTVLTFDETVGRTTEPVIVAVVQASTPLSRP